MNRSLSSLVQVSAALGVSLACYLVSAHVNAEHLAIDRLTRTIAEERRAVSLLGSLYEERKALPRVQKWSDADLAHLMSAPAPEQMVGAPAELAAYLPGRGGATATQAVVLDARAPEAAPVRVSVQAAPALVPVERPRPMLFAAQVGARTRVPAAPAPTRIVEVAAREKPRPERDLASAEIAARVPIAETPDIAELTRAIGRELRATTASPVRRVSLR